MLSENFLNNCVLVPTSAIFRPLFVFGDYEGDHRRNFCSLPKKYWARYFADKIKCGKKSELQKASVEPEVNNDEEGELASGDGESNVNSENDDSSALSCSLENNHNDFDEVHIGDKFNIDHDEDILNKNGPAIELYESELDDTDDNDRGDVDEDTTWKHRALELKEDQYWANHNSGESYLANTAEDASSDESDESTLS